MKYGLVRISFYTSLLLIIAFASATSVDARGESTCPGVRTTPGAKPTIVMEEVTYFTSSSTEFDSRATGNKIELRGLLYYKQATGQKVEGRPVLIYNHGHDAERGEPCAMVNFFTGQGWIVFAPLRRGHFSDRDKNKKRGANELRSTGLHIDEYVTKCMRVNALESLIDLPELYCSSKRCRPDVPCGMNFKQNAVELAYLKDQYVDVREQIKYMKLRPALGGRTKPGERLADPENITVAGHSYGGSLIVLANQHDLGQNVMIDISGAELSWGPDEPYWELDLVFAMHDQKRPIYFLQPENGITTQPTKVLSRIARQEGIPFEEKIFPPAPCSKTKKVKGKIVCDTSNSSAERQAHGTFITVDEQVALWGPTVIEFSERHVKKNGTKRRQS